VATSFNQMLERAAYPTGYYGLELLLEDMHRLNAELVLAFDPRWDALIERTIGLPTRLADLHLVDPTGSFPPRLQRLTSRLVMDSLGYPAGTTGLRQLFETLRELRLAVVESRCRRSPWRQLE
jgi:hypothetical protein